MVGRMFWAYLLVTLAAAAALEDRPPTIVSLRVQIGDPDSAWKTLVDPKDYTVFGNVDSLNKLNRNALDCKASNAEDVYWQYKKLEADTWSETLPSVVDKEQLVSAGDTVSREINDGQIFRNDDVLKLGGFYRCVAKYTTYMTISAPIQLIIVYIKSDGASSNLISGAPNQNKPFSIPCFDDDSNLLVPSDAVTEYDLDISFVWTVTEGDTVTNIMQYFEQPERLQIDPKTGTLHFAYLITDDTIERINQNGQNIALKCSATYKLQARSLDVGNWNTLKVVANNEPPKDIVVVSPRVDSNSVVLAAERPVCISHQECDVVIIFGGKNAPKGKIRAKDADGNMIENSGIPGFSFTAPESAGTLRYTVELYDDTTTQVYATIKVDVVIQNYPKLNAPEDFPEVRYVTTGSDVEFICDAQFADENNFFINGVQVTTAGTPSYVTSVFQNTLKIDEVKRENSLTVQCVSTNTKADPNLSIYKNSQLVVYDEAKLSKHPEIDYKIEKGSNETERYYSFACSVTLDMKADKVDLYWKTDLDKLKDVKITGKHAPEVKSVLPQNAKLVNGVVNSTLTIELDPDSQHTLPGSSYWCVVTYHILDSEQFNISSTKTLFDMYQPPTKATITAPWPHYPLLFGAIGGLVFLILLIILINCYVQKNKGEQYYVDEKERKAGHKPEEEMEAYGFSDYVRPDQNPIKGSRASINMSAGKPMDSDTGSLDEYGGDMDPSRYNEDGSFIGQYGENGARSRNQADV